MTREPLLPERHKNMDFFAADILGNLPFKDDMASMEHPMFSLSTKPDTRELKYKKDNVEIFVKPSYEGLPTIFDKDVLLYCGSLLMKEINKGKKPPRTLRVSVRDLLIATNRPIAGVSYDRLKKALDRLVGVTVKTNIKTNKREITNAFHILENYEIIESSRIKRRMVRLEITVSEWFYNSFVGREVLTISRDYFRLRKPTERRLYEIARKHCGKQKEWSIHLSTLQKKTGYSAPEKKFRFFIRQTDKDNHLPDYFIAFNPANDLVMFAPRMQTQFPELNYDQLNDITGDVIFKVREIVSKAKMGWTFDAVVKQFSDHMKKKGNPKNINGAFINFAKQKVKQAA